MIWLECKIVFLFAYRAETVASGCLGWGGQTWKRLPFLVTKASRAGKEDSGSLVWSSGSVGVVGFRMFPLLEERWSTLKRSEVPCRAREKDFFVCLFCSDRDGKICLISLLAGSWQSWTYGYLIYLILDTMPSLCFSLNLARKFQYQTSADKYTRI